MSKSKKTRKLRVQSVAVKLVLVWDDGTEFQPGPDVELAAFQPSELKAYVKSLPNELARLQNELEPPSAD